ncbi:MAG: hypothetical protein JWM34_4633 [Ilumatobacteraceae bacterium]|nr:hypothetical protein [Ilumatobacteraceae bacterium]
MTEPVTDRRLTHVELLDAPGERELAIELFALLGCDPVDRGGTFFTAFIDPVVRDYSTNVFYASEVDAEQSALEQAMITQLGAARDDYVAAMRVSPQRSTHFGFRVPDEPSLDAVLERVRRAAVEHPRLAGRVAVDHVYRPGDPGAIAPNMVQAFVWTDVVAAGLLCLGQHIEVQWHLPVS